MLGERGCALNGVNQQTRQSREHFLLALRRRAHLELVVVVTVVRPWIGTSSLGTRGRITGHHRGFPAAIGTL
ncbi:MAG: hypothetical protein ACREIR_11265 [Geminicoccaceae bacterium]